MVRLFFHIHNGDGFTADEEGREFESIEIAHSQALRDIRSIISDEVKHGRADLRGRVEVADEEGKIVMAVPFADAIDFPQGPLPEETDGA
jgi:hypothetical protein